MAFLQSLVHRNPGQHAPNAWITESVAASLAVHGGILYIGVVWGEAPGIYVGIVGLVAGHIACTLWLWGHP